MADNPLGKLWASWTRLARRIGDVQARALLTAFYFTVLAPFALLLRWRADPLAIRPGAPTGWRRRPEPTDATLERARQQS